MSNKRILLIDSGIGGLSLVGDLIARLPSVDLVYIADHKYFPYGVKAQSWLEVRLEKLVREVMEHQAIDLVVVACNTASTVVLPRLRQRFSIPFVGVVPAIKPAGGYSKKKSIGILATEGTVKRDYTGDLIQSYAADCRVIPVASHRLVELAEEKFFGQSPDPRELQAICQPFFEKGSAIVDVVVLGCTHFPFLKDDLQCYVSSDIHWLDSGAAVAQRVISLLGSSDHFSEGQRSFFSTSSQAIQGTPSLLVELGFKIKNDLLGQNQVLDV